MPHTKIDNNWLLLFKENLRNKTVNGRRMSHDGQRSMAVGHLSDLNTFKILILINAISLL